MIECIKCHKIDNGVMFIEDKTGICHNCFGMIDDWAEIIRIANIWVEHAENSLKKYGEYL